MSHFHFMIRTVKRIHDDSMKSLERILSNSINDTVTVHNTDQMPTSLVTPCSYPFCLQICQILDSTRCWKYYSVICQLNAHDPNLLFH